MIKEIPKFVRELFDQRRMLTDLTRRDFKNRFAGSILGFLWAFIQPIMMMGILWAVFTFGLKGGLATGDVPFVAWFFTAMIAWNFFVDSLNGSTNVIHEYSFLVRKVRFRIAILPLVKVFASSILHLIFVALLILILIAVGVYPNVYWLQFIYYYSALFILLVGLGWITSALNVFSKDVGQMVSIAVQFGFWGTPIVWDAGVIPVKFLPLLKLNPMFYIVEGYRGTFLSQTAFWDQSWKLTLYFWSFTGLTFLLGIYVFRRLRPHFADVL